MPGLVAPAVIVGGPEPFFILFFGWGLETPPASALRSWGPVLRNRHRHLRLAAETLVIWPARRCLQPADLCSQVTHSDRGVRAPPPARADRARRNRDRGARTGRRTAGGAPADGTGHAAELASARTGT